MTEAGGGGAADSAAAIEAALAAGDTSAAFARLRAAFGWPAGKAIPAAALPRWLALVAALATERGATPLAELAEQAVRDPDSPDRLYDLGYALIDAGAPEVAAAVLWRCLALVGDSEEVVCELVSALESALAYPDALAVLGEHAALRQHSFVCRYLYAYNAAMSGQLAVTRAALPALAPDTEDAHAMAARIAAIVARADAVAGVCPLDERDLRGWHYVLNGTLLIHQSPYGPESMSGRYAWLADSHQLIATGLDRLATLIRGRGLECIYAPAGRDHEIVARAASLRLGLPLALWPAVGVPAPGLVVAYDLADVSPAEVQQLIPRRADQIVFAHATSWTQDGPLAPDVTTLLYQIVVAPWRATTVPSEEGGLAVSPADPRSVEDIAAELAASPGLSAAELEADEPARWDALVAASWPPPATGMRSRAWAGGPVPSSRFD